MLADDVKRFMIRWNNRYPLDYWWRKKHNVPFLSQTHKEQSFLNQLMEYEEDCLYNELDEKDNSSIDEYIPNIGDIFKVPLLKEENTKKQIDAEDIEEFRRFAKEINEQEENGTGQDNKDIS